jgi:membrane fusion protein, multidrug efflux system
MKTGTKIWFLVIIGLLAVVGGLVGIKGAQFGAMGAAQKAMQIPPEAVSSAKVQATEWQATRPVVGSLVPLRSVLLGSELQGIVKSISFDSGQSVRAGQELVRLDTSTEEAQLAAAVADATLAHQSLERAQKLRADNTNTAADLDSADARAKQADANVAQLKAVIAKKTIRAPFDGRLGIRQVELGQILGNGAPITTLQSVSPMHAEFFLPQETLSELQLGMAARVTTDIFPKDQWEGRLTVINSEVEVATRNVKVRATVPNPDGRLRAGMFVNVEVLSSDKRPVLVIPATSVIYAPYGDSVFTVEQAKPEPAKEGEPQKPFTPGLIAHQKFVRLGERRGDLVAVASGLTAGEEVVSSGAFKLRNNAGVVVKADLSPKPELAPRPLDK